MSDLDDCFKASDQPITVAEAIARFSDNLGGIAQSENVPVREALGRILASELTARHDIPPHDNSAVDGYAVYFDDLSQDGETRLPVTGRIAAGHPLKRPAKRGEAVQIFTGAPVPEGADDTGPDTIFMVEDCQVEGDEVILPSGIKRDANHRKAGEDVKTGDVILSPGHKLRPQDVSMAASLGYAEVEVYRRLKVAVFSTGDEIQDVGAPLEPGHIYDANRYSLISMLEQLGCDVTDVGIFPDVPGDIRAGLWQAADNHDLLVTSGGVSKGEEDHIKDIIEDLGALNFWNLAIKPGRPIALGHIEREGVQVPFIGLPGNPVAVMVTFIRIARPLILLLSGAKDLEPKLFQVVAGFDIKKKPGRREWLRARLEQDEAGKAVAVKFEAEGSGIISSMVESDGLVELPEECELVKQGDLVDFLPFSEVM
jgi:molybdopterin molybdotransferase